MWYAVVVPLLVVASIACSRATPVTDPVLAALSTAPALHLQHGRRGLDRRSLCPSHAGCFLSERPRRVADALAATFSASTTIVDSIYRCGDSPATCTIAGFDELLALSDPLVNGDTAHVALEVWRLSASSRQPVARQRLVALVVRRGTAWQTVSVDDEGQS